MAKGQMQKTKLLEIYDYLQKNTDENHGVTRDEIISYLNSCGIACERKAVYTDIEALQSYGADIVQMRNGNKTVYSLASRIFETAELKMLVDIIGASRFMTVKKSGELIRKIETLCSVHEAKSLSRNVYLTGRVKTVNEIIYVNIDKIHTAFNEEKTILFKYFNYDWRKRKVYRNNGELSEAVPVALVWNNDNYYLVAYNSENGTVRHFRVDKMESISEGRELTSEERDYCKKYDTSKFSKMVFDMFGGEPLRVELSCTEKVINSMYDRFGLDLVMKKGENGRFVFNVLVELSPTFYAWISTFKGEVKLLSPESAVTGYREHIESIVKSFDED